VEKSEAGKKGWVTMPVEKAYTKFMLGQESRSDVMVEGFIPVREGQIVAVQEYLSLNRSGMVVKEVKVFIAQELVVGGSYSVVQVVTLEKIPEGQADPEKFDFSEHCERAAREARLRQEADSTR
jgi:hypothetical protein